MASIYDKSSLVLIPSGTKTGKVFSQKPVSGDGDFTFTRASAATRVNADGNIEKETQNLLYQSNNFSSGFWTTPSLSVTGGQSGYDGSSNAWLVTLDSNSGSVRQDVTHSGVQTFSVYAKAGNTDWVALYIDSVSTDKPYVYFDLSNGVVGTNVSGNAITGDIEDAGGGWYRCSIIYNRSTNQVRIFPADSNNVLGTTGDTIYIQDAQLEQGLVARDYIDTTTPVYGGITDNTPRLDYTDSSCPALLLEPQRTNSLEFSEYFEGSYWISTRLDLSIDSSNSPEGVSNAYNFVPTATSGTHYIYDATSVTSGQDQTFSIYAKANGYDYFSIRFNTNNAVFGNDEIVFNLNDGSIESQDADITNSSIESVGNDWYRVSATRESLASSSGFILIRIFSNATTDNFTGDGTSGILFYGAQWEQDASYATSYIPTYGSSVSRVAEASLKTGVADLINDGDGTLYMEVTPTNFEGDQRFGISDNIGANRIVLRLYNPSNLQFSCVINSSVEVSIANSGYSSGNTYKIAGAWKNNDAVIYINGVQVATDTNCNITPSNPLTRISFDNGVGTAKWENPVSQTLYFPTRLSNEELAALTTI